MTKDMNVEPNDKTVLVENITDRAPSPSLTNPSDQTLVSADMSEATVFSPQKSRAEVSGYDRLCVGSVIKQRFHLSKRLGEGGMGCVYLAEDKLKLEANSPDPYVAIKILGGDFKTHPAAFVSLQRETQKSQQLAHPNIITAYDFDRDGDIIYMTMEALRGDDLDSYILQIRDRDRDTAASAEIVLSIAKGLAYAHSKGVIHSDLKPANIFLTDQQVVKILDFGIARAASDGSNQVVDSFDAGALGALTPTYASCEMFDGGDPAPSDDIYALGIIAYQLFSGEHPFNRMTSVDARNKGLRPKRLKNVNRHQWRAINKALMFDPKKRINTSVEFERVFKGPSKLKRSIGALLTAFVLVSCYFVYHLNYVVTTQIDFEDLSVEKQAEFRDEMVQAAMAVKFGDENATLFHLNNAFILHPYNNKVMSSLDEIVDDYLIRDVQLMGKKELSDFSYHINALLQYEALADNADLRTLKKRIDTLLIQ